MPLLGSSKPRNPGRDSGNHNSGSTHKSGLFSRRRSDSTSSYDDHEGSHRHVEFHDGERSSSSSGRSRRGRNTIGRSKLSLFSRGHASNQSHNSPDFSKDPSILAAKKRITDAESAERAADQALNDARMAMKMAREHCKDLEREVKEE